MKKLAITLLKTVITVAEIAVMLAVILMIPLPVMFVIATIGLITLIFIYHYHV